MCAYTPSGEARGILKKGRLDASGIRGRKRRGDFGKLRVHMRGKGVRQGTLSLSVGKKNSPNEGGEDSPSFPEQV